MRNIKHLMSLFVQKIWPHSLYHQLCCQKRKEKKKKKVSIFSPLCFLVILMKILKSYKKSG